LKKVLEIISFGLLTCITPKRHFLLHMEVLLVK
jgi:hypothetical protein